MSYEGITEDFSERARILENLGQNRQSGEDGEGRTDHLTPSVAEI